MISFRDWLENNLYRIDSQKQNFSDKTNLGHYFFLSGDESTKGSGRIYPNEEMPDWTQGKKGYVKQGLFAGKLKEIIPYMVPRNVPYVITYETPKNTIHFNQNDLPKIQSYKPYISSFSNQNFQYMQPVTGAEEYFSENPPTLAKQKQINNPIRYLNKFFTVKFEKDLQTFVKYLKSQNINFTAEALPSLV